MRDSIRHLAVCRYLDREVAPPLGDTQLLPSLHYCLQAKGARLEVGFAITGYPAHAEGIPQDGFTVSLSEC